MKHLDIKDYVREEEKKLKTFAQECNIDNKIKLGIIDATRGDAESAIHIKKKLEDFARMGWKAEVYKVRKKEESCRKAVIRAMRHGCTSVSFQLPMREDVNLHPYDVPRFLECDGLRPDSLVTPTVPLGIIDYLKACEFPFSGKTAVILGRSDTVGKPMAKLLLDEDMTVSICHSKSDLNIVSGLLCDADLVICATNKPYLVVRSQCMDAVVIDVGITRQNGKLIGDFEEKPELCTDTAWSTPVPSGVGLLTRLALLKNCVYLTKESICINN